MIIIKYSKSKSSLIIKLFAIALGIYLIYSLISMQVAINKKKEELNILKQQYSEGLIKNEELQKTVDSYGTDEFIEKQARSFGYADKDEQYYIDISGSDKK